MINSTFLKRVPELLTKKGNLKRTYFNVIEALKFLGIKDNKYYPIRWTRNKNHYNLLDKKFNDLTYILGRANIDFIVGNDAPKNGKEGIFIQLTKTGINQVTGLNVNKLLNL